MIEYIQKYLMPIRQEIVEHPLFHSIEEAEDLRIFMEHHVFAVWDFMTLLKTLQARITCVRTPWVPAGDPAVRRLINEIVLGEETDERPDGRGYASHFELYLEAMENCGADTGPIRDLTRRISAGEDAAAALEACPAPEAAKDFVRWTLLAAEGPVHTVAAAFTFGREELVPDLFGRIIHSLAGRFPERIGPFKQYLQRHIDLDGQVHTPLAFKMLAALCGNDPSKWSAARETANEALVRRKILWDAAAKAIGRPVGRY